MNYAQLAKNADKQLAKFGQEITVARYASSRNTATGIVTKGTATLSGIANAIEVPVTVDVLDTFAATLEPGALVSKILRTFKVSALLGFQPAPLDEVTLPDNTVWPVVGCTPINPAGTPILYTIGVAK
jgi:hypothetical protein